MSVGKGEVGAEIFAATSPGNNKKLFKDLQKMKLQEGSYKHRYVFFAAPTHPVQERQFGLEKEAAGVKVWSLEL